ncbi:MAG: tetratricopeptide repeat protein [Mesorhizobium sp.]
MKFRHFVLMLAAAAAFAAPAFAQGEPKAETKTGTTGEPAVVDEANPAAAKEPDAATSEADPTAPSEPNAAAIDQNRFGQRPADEAFGAFQRGLYITALNLALPRAEKGDLAAMTLVAEIYGRGLGVPLDEKKAAEWYEKAADKGVPEARFQLALILLDGKHAKADPVRARTLMQAAADAGNLLAQFNLAQMIIGREPGSVGTAIDYYEKAAKGGLPDAQYAMAQVYANGTGGRPVDDVEARRWMALAAQRNFDSAQVELGSWMVEGKGGPRDMKAGFGWIRRAALGGNVAGQNRLAKLYVEGLGVDPDIIEGAAWYVVAKRAGLTDRYMEDVLDGLTDEQKKQAIERANRLR